MVVDPHDKLVALGGCAAIVSLTVVPSPSWSGELEPDNAPLLRAHGMLALWGIIITAVALLAFIRIYTHAIRRRWRQPTAPSRMSPLQWQARRWREARRKSSQPESHDP